MGYDPAVAGTARCRCAVHLFYAGRVAHAQLAMQGLDVNIWLYYSHRASTLATDGCCYRFQVHKTAKANLNLGEARPCLLRSS